MPIVYILVILKLINNKQINFVLSELFVPTGNRCLEINKLEDAEQALNSEVGQHCKGSA